MAKPGTAIRGVAEIILAHKLREVRAEVGFTRMEPAAPNLEGAACHGCLFIAEPSCERNNRFLDRALVVPTIGRDPALAFFSERP